ncbi:unnamed protein product, partial [marine sediment metagenome]
RSISSNLSCNSFSKLSMTSILRREVNLYEFAELFDKEERKKARTQLLNSQNSLITSLYLATSYWGKTLYFSANLDNIQKQLDGYSKVIFSSFTSCCIKRP